MGLHYKLKKAKNGQFHFNLQFRSGEIILVSEMFASESSAKNTITMMQESLKDEDNFEVKKSNDDLFYFVLKAPNHQVIGISEMYTSELSARRAIQNLVQVSTKAIIDYDYNETRENVKRVGSVVTFLNLLQTNESKFERYSLFFRGHNDVTYDLTPSIYRKKHWLENENRFYRELMLRCPQDFQSANIVFQKLVKMQHYALPTRLLDITSNPLIALFFATEQKVEDDRDGEVVILKIPKEDIKYYDDAGVSVLSNISKQPLELDNDNLMTQDDFNSLLHDVRVDGCYVNNEIEIRHLNKVLCVKPQMDNPRIIKQDGLFLLFGIDGAKNKPAKIPESYLNPYSFIIIIPKEFKEKIRNQLEVCGISPSTVYPEIEHVANHLKSKFNV